MKLRIKEQVIEKNAYEISALQSILKTLGIECETEHSVPEFDENNVNKSLTIHDIKDELPARFITILEYMYNFLSVDTIPVYWLVKELTPKELMSYRNCGKDTIQKVRDVFKNHGFIW